MDHMKEFKTASFVIFDAKGSAHKVACDKIEGDHPTFSMRGDAELLLRRWKTMSGSIEMFLKGQLK